ncbi:hypothetical protein PSAC2689_20259 [Paraburkholderia sacchari]
MAGRRSSGSSACASITGAGRRGIRGGLSKVALCLRGVLTEAPCVTSTYKPAEMLQYITSTLQQSVSQLECRLRQIKST